MLISDKPSTPPSISVSHLTANSATICWEKPLDDGGSPLLHYILEKREEGRSKWGTLTTLPAGAYECELENMASGKDYFVRIIAVNKHGPGVAAEMKEPIRVTGQANGENQSDILTQNYNTIQYKSRLSSYAKRIWFLAKAFASALGNTQTRLELL